MTIHEAIEQADKEKPNTIDTATKECWISALESLIQQELQIVSIGSVLSVREPYAVMYSKYLIMRICLENGELDNYNAAAATFNRLWKVFAESVIQSQDYQIRTRGDEEPTQSEDTYEESCQT